MLVPLIVSAFKSVLASCMFSFLSTKSFFYICSLMKAIIKFQLNLEVQSCVWLNKKPKAQQISPFSSFSLRENQIKKKKSALSLEEKKEREKKERAILNTGLSQEHFILYSSVVSESDMSWPGKELLYPKSEFKTSHLTPNTNISSSITGKSFPQRDFCCHSLHLQAWPSRAEVNRMSIISSVKQDQNYQLG